MPNRAVAVLTVDDVAALDAESRRRLRVELDHGLPRDLGDRIRQFLEPRLVRAATVAEQRTTVDVTRKKSPVAAARRSSGHGAVAATAPQPSGRAGVAIMPFGSAVGERRAAARERDDQPRAIVGAGYFDAVAGSVFATAISTSAVRARLYVEHRIHRRLLQPIVPCTGSASPQLSSEW